MSRTDHSKKHHTIGEVVDRNPITVVYVALATSWVLVFQVRTVLSGMLP